MIGARPVVLERRLTAGRTAPGRLHLDHLGAEIGQELAAVLALGAREFQDSHAVQRLRCGSRLRHRFDPSRLTASFAFARPSTGSGLAALRTNGEWFICYPRRSSGSNSRPVAPTYRELGRNRRLLSICSMMCADQPTTRLMAKIGVFSAIGIFIMW